MSATDANFKSVINRMPPWLVVRLANREGLNLIDLTTFQYADFLSEELDKETKIKILRFYRDGGRASCHFFKLSHPIHARGGIDSWEPLNAEPRLGSNRLREHILRARPKGPYFSERVGSAHEKEESSSTVRNYYCCHNCCYSRLSISEPREDALG